MGAGQVLGLDASAGNEKRGTKDNPFNLFELMPLNENYGTLLSDHDPCQSHRRDDRTQYQVLKVPCHER